MGSSSQVLGLQMQTFLIILKFNFSVISVASDLQQSGGETKLELPHLKIKKSVCEVSLMHQLTRDLQTGIF